MCSLGCQINCVFWSGKLIKLTGHFSSFLPSKLITWHAIVVVYFTKFWVEPMTQNINIASLTCSTPVSWLMLRCNFVVASQFGWSMYQASASGQITNLSRSVCEVTNISGSSWRDTSFSFHGCNAAFLFCRRQCRVSLRKSWEWWRAKNSLLPKVALLSSLRRV